MTPSLWGWPQWTVVALWAMRILIDVSYDGEPRKGKHNGSLALFATVLSAVILWNGGFFR